MRLVGTMADPKPYRPYYRPLLHGGDANPHWWAQQPLPTEDERAIFALAFFAGCDGVALWNWSDVGNHQVAPPLWRAGATTVVGDQKVEGGIGADVMLKAGFTLQPEGTPPDGPVTAFKRYDVLPIVEVNEATGIVRFQHIDTAKDYWGPRFDIGFTDSDGQFKPCPVILHASSFGSIERTICTLLENIAVDQDNGKPPCFPLWLSPTQVRVAPVKEDYIGFAEQFADLCTQARVRADVDDRQESVGRKVRDAEVEWVPYTIVVGQRETLDGELTVRCREEQDDKRKLTADALIANVRERTGDVPWLPLPIPRRLSKRPIFGGSAR